MSIAIRILLQLFGQRWITTTAHTSTLVFLPIITYTISNVISGNIALSLGMVGALSIVRFRNPVRSPLELSVYFGAITMGIAAMAGINWLAFLFISIVAAALTLLLLNLASSFMFKQPFFTSSFSEGNHLATLNLRCSKEIEEIDDSKYLVLKRNIIQGFEYQLAANDFEALKVLEKKFKNNPSVNEYQLVK